MVRRRKDQGGTLLALAVIALALLGPPLLLIGWLVAELRARGSATDDLSAIDAESRRAAAHVEALFGDGDALGLDRRQDGYFDARSRDGRALNDRLAAAEAEAANAEAALQAALAVPAQRDGARAAVLTWLGVFGWIAHDDLVAWARSGVSPAGGDFFYPSGLATAAALAIGWLWYRTLLSRLRP